MISGLIKFVALTCYFPVARVGLLLKQSWLQQSWDFFLWGGCEVSLRSSSLHFSAPLPTSSLP